MSKSHFLVATMTALLTGSVYAQVDLETQPIVAEVARNTVEGEVMVVNTDTRLMTVKTADGSYEVLHVPPEVKRLDEVKIGDMVSITETAASLIELQSGRDAGAMGAVGSTEAMRLPGDKPAGALADTMTLYGKIVAVDKTAGTVTIKGPETTHVFPVDDRTLLDEVKVGDGVVAKYRNVITGEVTVK